MRLSRTLALALILFAISPFQSARAHPMTPDLTVAQLKIHYHLLEVALRAPSSEVVLGAGVVASDLVGDATSPATLKKLNAWLPSKFTLEQDGKPLKGEIPYAFYRNYSVGPECEMTIHYVTDKPAERLKVMSKFIHTIVSASGMQFEMRSEKETTREFSTNANLNNIWNNVVDFVHMGMEHLFTGTDHILFICTLIFACMDFKSVVKMLTGFTVGHSVTLILSTFNFIHFPARFADMGIALTIVYVGLENIFRKELPTNRWWLVTGFGLVHGMSFSASLKEVGLPEQGLVLCLLGFNVGIELAQIIIVACVYPVLSRWRWRMEALTVPKEEGARAFRRQMNVGSALTACVGCYWFLALFLSH